MPLSSIARLTSPHIVLSIASLSASLYQIGWVNVPNLISDGDQIRSRFGLLDVSQRGVQSREFGSFPSGIAYFLHLGDGAVPMTLAASLSIPRNINRRFIVNTEFLGDGTAIKESITTVIQEQSYMAALSWAAGFGDLRVGASVLGAYTSSLRTSDRSQLEVQGTLRFIRTQARDARSVESFDLGVLVGAQYDVADWLQVGVGVRSPSLHLSGTFTGSVDFTRIDSNADPMIAAVQQDGDGVRGFPLRFGAGVQMRGESWALAFDGTVYVPRGEEYRLVGTQVLSDIGGNDRPDAEREFRSVDPTKTRVNAAVGFEYAITDTNWLRLGAFTELSALESASETLAALPPNQGTPPALIFHFPIHRFGFSAGWGTKLGPIDTTFGVRGTIGSGDTIRDVPDERYMDGRATAETTSATLAEGLFFLSAAIDVAKGASELIGAVGDGPAGVGQ